MRGEPVSAVAPSAAVKMPRSNDPAIVQGDDDVYERPYPRLVWTSSALSVLLESFVLDFRPDSIGASRATDKKA